MNKIWQEWFHFLSAVYLKRRIQLCTFGIHALNKAPPNNLIRVARSPFCPTIEQLIGDSLHTFFRIMNQVVRSKKSKAGECQTKAGEDNHGNKPLEEMTEGEENCIF